MLWDFSSLNDVNQAISDCYVLYNGKPVLVRYVDTDDGDVNVSRLDNLPELLGDIFPWDGGVGWEIKLPENGNYNIFGTHGWCRLTLLPERQWRKALRANSAIEIEWPGNHSITSFLVGKAILYNHELPSLGDTLERFNAGDITSAAISRSVGIHSVKEALVVSHNGIYVGIIRNNILELDPRMSILYEELSGLGFTILTKELAS